MNLMSSSMRPRESHCDDPPCACTYRKVISSAWKNFDSELNFSIKKESFFPDSHSASWNQETTFQERNPERFCIYSASSDTVA